MATAPIPSPEIWQDRMSQWLQSQASQNAPTQDKIATDPAVDIDEETVILRPAWPRVFPPL
jgi:hypothetical protein